MDDSPEYDGRVVWEFRETHRREAVLLSVVGAGRLLASTYFRAKALSIAAQRF